MYDKVGWEPLEGVMIQQQAKYAQYASSIDIPELKDLIKEKPKNNKSEQLWAAIKAIKGDDDGGESQPESKPKAPKGKAVPKGKKKK